MTEEEFDQWLTQAVDDELSSALGVSEADIDRMVAGELSPSEQRALFDAHDSEAQVARAALTPLGSGFQARMAERWSQALEPTQAPTALAPPFASASESPPTPGPANRPGGFGARWAWRALVPLTAVAAALLALWWQRTPVGGQLPQYTLAHAAGGQILRGMAPPRAEFIRLSSGDQFQAVLTPQTQPTDPVQVVVFAVPAAGPAQVLSLPTQVAASGAIRLTGVMGQDMTLAAGRYQVIMAVGHQGTPLGPNLAQQCLAGGVPDWQCTSVQWVVGNPG